MSESGSYDRMGGSLETGHPHFVECTVEKNGEWFSMPLSAWLDPESGGITLANFDGYKLPPSEVRALFALALKASCYYGEADILEGNRLSAQAKLAEAEERRRKSKIRPPKIPKAGYVYLLYGDGAYKIGKAGDVSTRAKQFGVELSFEVDVIWQAYFADYTTAELGLHQMFAEKRLRGEWFDLDADDLRYITALTGDER